MIEVSNYCFNKLQINEFVFCLPSVQSKVDGGWGPWGTWGPCSATCGGGTRKKLRNCDKPKPQNGGKSCNSDGSANEKSESCNSASCPGISIFLLD